MEKYIYLAEGSHALTWVTGGKVPLKPASTYKSVERKGVYTPDENLIYDSPVDFDRYKGFGSFDNVKGLTITDCSDGNGKLPNIVNVSRYQEDGLVLCMCNVLDEHIMSRLSKKACIEIYDLQTLKDSFDQQIGQISASGDCQYTESH
jgi:hypothetical protein